MTTPAGFDSSFLRARAVRHGRHPAPVRPQAPLDASSLIPWREFAQAIFNLPQGWDYHGDLPEGVSAQQFWSRVNRASKQATRRQRRQSMKELGHAKVGIVTRGDRFWVWPIVVPIRDADEKVAIQRRGWIGKLLLELRSGEPVELGRVLTDKEKHRLRERADRKGWMVHIGTRNGNSRVQWIGERS